MVQPSLTYKLEGVKGPADTYADEEFEFFNTEDVTPVSVEFGEHGTGTVEADGDSTDYGYGGEKP